MIAPIVTDENKAPFVPESQTRASYHCPRTNCDGHFYLRPAELGREFVCEKCGLPVTIGQAKGRVADARNYRRGLRRVYLVLAVAWIAGVTATLSSGHWQPWRSTLPAWVTQNETLQPSSSDPGVTITPETFLHDEAMKEIRHRTWIWDTSLSIGPPLLLYALLFGIVPWIYRGFKPGTRA